MRRPNAHLGARSDRQSYDLRYSPAKSRAGHSRRGTGAIWSIGIGAQPLSAPSHEGCCNVTPLRPHSTQRAFCRNMFCQPPGPHRMMNGAIATAAMWRVLEELLAGEVLEIRVVDPAIAHALV